MINLLVMVPVIGICFFLIVVFSGTAYNLYDRINFQKKLRNENVD